jgi:hypothetical protein
VFLANKDAVLEMLSFNEDIAGHPPQRRRGAVRAFHPHPRHLQSIMAVGQDSPAPDFGRPIRACRTSRCRGRKRAMRTDD